jgi:hypothetical protein
LPHSSANPCSKEFGGGLFALAASVVADLIHHDPLSYRSLEEAGLPQARQPQCSVRVLCCLGLHHAGARCIAVELVPLVAGLYGDETQESKITVHLHVGLSAAANVD